MGAGVPFPTSGYGLAPPEYSGSPPVTPSDMREGNQFARFTPLCTIHLVPALKKGSQSTQELRRGRLAPLGSCRVFVGPLIPLSLKCSRVYDQGDVAVRRLLSSAFTLLKDGRPETAKSFHCFPARL